MGFDKTTRKYYEIFHPHYLEEVTKITSENRKFVYYTSAETAMKVIQNNELWFRNATVMNDFSEIQYGLQLISSVFSGTEGKNFRTAIDDIYSGTIDQAQRLITEWMQDWKFETYIACVSVHDTKEDNRGRLSMWRTYGNTALVVNNTPMTAVTDRLAIFSTPVLYLLEDDLAKHLAQVTDAITANKEYLKSLGKEMLVEYIRHMLFLIAIATKHPGFEEEKEWRLYYRPSEGISPAMTADTVVLNGVPQTIYKLKLAHEPENGLFHADMPSLLDKVIIGPTGFPYVTQKAFMTVLQEIGVEEPGKKVIVSDIPLRVG